MTKELARKAFRGLNPSLQDTFILQKAEGWTNRELAQALGITVPTVKSRIFRARVRLCQQLLALTNSGQLLFRTELTYRFDFPSPLAIALFLGRDYTSITDAHIGPCYGHS